MPSLYVLEGSWVCRDTGPIAPEKGANCTHREGHLKLWGNRAEGQSGQTAQKTSSMESGHMVTTPPAALYSWWPWGRSRVLLLPCLSLSVHLCPSFPSVAPFFPSPSLFSLSSFPLSFSLSPSFFLSSHPPFSSSFLLSSLTFSFLLHEEVKDVPLQAQSKLCPSAGQKILCVFSCYKSYSWCWGEFYASLLLLLRTHWNFKP